MLIAARSSQDFACCWRATASARSKYIFCFRRIWLRRHQRDFAGNAINLGLPPPFLGSFHRKRLLRQCSAKHPRIGEGPHRLSPDMIAKSAKPSVAPVDRYAVIPEVIW